MPYIKVVKTKAYFKRFQVKFKRRREGKTDYYARKRLIVQDKNKYNSHKYRLVVRFSNKDIVAQIVFATIDCDRVFAHAYAHELSQFGIPAGHKNYSSAYATGLLVARRALTKLGLADQYVGKEKADGQYYLVEEEGERKPFYVLLDAGLARTTTGCRVFGVLKGAVDGGLEIPHSTRRFAGYDSEKEKFNPAILRKYIFGGHVADYMRLLQSEDPEKYNKQFSVFAKNKITADDVEGVYAKAHAAIRKNPILPKKKALEKPKIVKTHKKKTSLAEKKGRVNQKLAVAAKKAQQ
jgi:large subunit ribosomal protein L5e